MTRFKYMHNNDNNNSSNNDGDNDNNDNDNNNNYNDNNNNNSNNNNNVDWILFLEVILTINHQSCMWWFGDKQANSHFLNNSDLMTWLHMASQVPAALYHILLVNLTTRQCHWNLLVIGYNWFRLCSGAIRQQANTPANFQLFYSDIWRHFAKMG